MAKDLSGWTIVIDLDGTLVETAPDLHAALNFVLESEDLRAVDLADIRMMIGDGAKALIRKGLAHNSVEPDENHIDTKLWPMFLKHYEANITRHSHLYEGALDTLHRLKASGAKLAICTNKAQHLAEQALSEMDIADQFDSILGGDRAQSKKPDGAHITETVELASGNSQQAIMIGDSHTDERAACDAKLPFIMVSFGYGALSGAPLPHLELVDHWSEMEAAINRIAL